MTLKNIRFTNFNFSLSKNILIRSTFFYTTTIKLLAPKLLIKVKLVNTKQNNSNSKIQQISERKIQMSRMKRAFGK